MPSLMSSRVVHKPEDLGLNGQFTAILQFGSSVCMSRYEAGRGKKSLSLSTRSLTITVELHEALAITVANHKSELSPLLLYILLFLLSHGDSDKRGPPQWGPK